MKIGVLLKQVPSSDERIKIAGPDAGVDTSSVKWEVNPYDEFALEAALQLKDAGSAEEVVLFTVGGSDAEAKIRDGLARGASRAVRVEADGADALGIAKVLAQAAASEGISLLLAGKQAIDTDNSQVPPMVAEFLGWPQVTDVARIEFSASGLKAWRNSGGGSLEVVEAPYPAVISCDKGLNKPRYAKLKDIMKAKRKKIAVVQGDAGAPVVSLGSWAPPAPRPAGRILQGDPASAVAELVSLLRSEAKVL